MDNLFINHDYRQHGLIKTANIFNLYKQKLSPQSIIHRPKMNQQTENATLLRRIAAIFYDVLLLLGVLFAASAIAVAINHGNAVSHPAYYASLLALTFIFYGWFWTHGGQTLGLRTWNLKLTNKNTNKITWKQAAVRFLCAFVSFLPAGAGFFWMLIDKEGLALHDRLSATRIIKLSRPTTK